MIVRGLAAILIALYSGRPPAEIADTDAIAIFDELGLREHLSTQRSNGLVAMVNRIRSEARALVALITSRSATDARPPPSSGAAAGWPRRPRPAPRP